MFRAAKVVRGYAKWIVSPYLLWSTFLILSVALTYGFWFPLEERRLVLAGTGLQLMAALMGFKVWNSTRKLFGLKFFLDEIRAFWKNMPGRNVTVELTGSAAIFEGGDAILSVATIMRPELSVNERLAALEFNVTQLKKEASESNERNTASIAKLRADMGAKIASTHDTLAAETATIRKAQTDGIWQAFVALVLLFVGTAMIGLPSALHLEQRHVSTIPFNLDTL